MWGKSVRFFSPQHVVNEIQSVVDQYGLNFIIFLDDNFTTNRRWLSELSALIEEKGLNKRVKFDCESIAAYMDDEKAELLVKMGVVRVEFGFESGSPRILQILKDGKSRLEQHERAIEICHRHGLMMVGNMIIGYINETPEEFQESARWYRSQRIDYIVPHIYTPYPGTAGWKECLEMGLIKEEEVEWETFLTDCGVHNLIVNTKSPKEEIERRFQMLVSEFEGRNRALIIDSGLSLMEKWKLYSLAAKMYKRDFIRMETNQEMPWRHYFIGLLYPGHIRQLLRRFPGLYFFLKRLKYSQIALPKMQRASKKDQAAPGQSL